MIVEAAQGWNVFKQSVVEHWDGFKHGYPRYHTRYYDGLVDKMLGCGNPDKRGSIAYRCQPCGQGKHLVSMRGQSSLCLRCAKVYVDDWVSQVSRMRHEGVLYRHILLTMPEMLRTTFSRQSKNVLSPLMRCGVRGVDDFFRRVSGKPLTGGDIVVVQSHGRSGQDNPHLHIIATSGGGDQEAKQWVHLDYVPSSMLRKKWPWSLLTMLRQTLKSRAINRLIALCSTRYRNGFVTNVPKGDVPSRSQSLARYLATYGVSRPISLRRIDRYDGQQVTYHSGSHKRKRVAWETVAVYTVIGRRVQHTFPKGCKRIRSDGVQATKTFAKVKGLIQEALATGKGIVKGAVKSIASLTDRQRAHQRSGRDPFICPHGHEEMGVWKVWHPQYGVVYDELKAMQKGRYESAGKRACA